MARTPEEREKARELRRQGWSLRQISDELGIALSTASVWLRDVPRASWVELIPGARPFVGVHLPIWRSGKVQCCSRCRVVMPDVLFNRMGDGRQGYCRECFRAYFRDRGRKHRQQSDTAKAARRARARAHVLAFLGAHPCVDCGTADLLVLEFDHVGVKQAAVSALVAEGKPLRRIDQEISECEVVCANCHRRRTYRRAGVTRLAPTGVPRRDRNRRYVLDLLARSRCIDCGEADVSVLEFDHVGVKSGAVSLLVAREASIARLQAEIEQCEIRCSNCHRRQTSARGGHHRSTAV